MSIDLGTRTASGLLTLVVVCLNMLVAEGSWAQSHTIETKVLFRTTFHPKNGPLEIYTPITHFKGYTFVVMPDENLIPMVMQIPDKPTENDPIRHVPLDPNDDYRALADPHNGFSIGVDSDGYVHIAGDMHQYGGADSRKYPDRYQKKHMLYWRSNEPWDISSGFSFMGGDRSTSMPGTSWSYGRFVNNKHGALYFSARVRAFYAGRYGPGVEDTRGAMGLGLYKYDTKTKTWSAIGAEPDPVGPQGSKYFPVFFWNHAGRPDTGFAYQVYQAEFSFDLQDRLHFAGSGYVDTHGHTAVVYARSDDGGKTWQKADDTPIPGLPLRGEHDTPNQADRIDSFDGKNGWITKVVGDQDGKPAVLHGNTADNWRAWNGRQWVHPGRQRLWGTSGAIAPDGLLLFVSQYGVASTRAFDQPAAVTSGGNRGVWCPSKLGILTTGRIYGLRQHPKSRTLAVVRLTVTHHDN